MPDLRRYWVYSDPHWFHMKLVEYGRPENFGDLMFENLMAVLRPRDVLICAGDLSLGKERQTHELYIERIKREVGCLQWLLLGNHDNKSISWYLDHGWDFAGRSITLDLFGLRIRLSHKAGRGKFDVNVHGHWHDSTHRSHEPDQIEFVGSPVHKLLAMEYTNYKPVLLEEFVSEFVSAKQKARAAAKLEFNLSKLNQMIDDHCMEMGTNLNEPDTL